MLPPTGRNPAYSQRNAEEAPPHTVRQAARMNYNNFASRISAPRVIPLSHSPVPAPETGKKPRKRSPRRRSATAALLLMLTAWIQGAGGHAADLPGSFPDPAQAFISAQGLPDAGSFGKAGLSPITEALLGIGLAVAVIQARLLLGRGELEC